MPSNIISILSGCKTGAAEVPNSVGSTDAFDEELSLETLKKIQQAAQPEVGRIQALGEPVFTSSLLGDDAWD